MSEFLPEGKLINNRENLACLSSIQGLREAMRTQKILEAPAVVREPDDDGFGRMLGFENGIVQKEFQAGFPSFGAGQGGYVFLQVVVKGHGENTGCGCSSPKKHRDATGRACLSLRRHP